MLLMSPRFVNHLELDGTPIAGRSDYLALDPYEIASRLSYTFWQTMPDDALLAAAADGSLATDAGFATQLDRVFADPRTRDTIWQFWNEWMRFESFTGFAAERPAFMALAAGENLGVAGHDHWGDMVREIRDLTELYTWTQTRDARRPPDVGRVGHEVGRSRPPLRRAGLERQRRLPALPDGSRARAPAARGAARVQPRADQPVPPRARSSGDRSSATTCRAPTRTACRRARSIRRRRARRMTTRQRFAAKVDGNGLCQACHASFSNLGYVLEAYDALGRFRTMEKVFDEQTGALLATLPIDTSAVPQVDRRRHAPGERPGRAEPAHHRERQGRGLPVGQLLPLRAAPRSDRATARTPARTRRCAAASTSGGGAGGRLPRHRGERRLPSAERWGRHEPNDAPRRMFLKGAGGAVLALPFLESLAAAAGRRAGRRRRPSASSCSSRSARS